MSEQLEVGQIVADRYEIRGLLGSGGFGTTYEASDRTTGVRVALKALDLSRVEDWKAVELFEREARTLEQLDHPNIPDYVEFIPVREDETGYLIQTLAPGISLEQHLERQGSLTNEEVHRVAISTLEVLDYLAGLNPPVIHRDIKPSNLLYDDGTVNLVDFGAVQDVAKHTISGGSTVAGTFGYMAPEQLHGAATPASDLYALGMTLIHLASGIHPSTLERDGLRVLFRERVNLPDRLLDLIERLVQADPNQRFQTPADALAFLDAAQTQELAPGAPQAGPAGAFGPDIGELVAREERDEQDRKRREMQRAERELAKRASRVKVDARDDEILLEVKRKTSWLIPVPIIAFLIVNPGVFVVQEFFLGSWWPVFTENVLARWLVWGLFVLATVVGVFKLLTPPLRVRLTRDGHFMKYGWSPNRPQTVGKFERINVALHAETNGVDPDTAALLLRDSDGETVLAERFANLSVADARAIDSVARWEGFGDPEVVLYNRESEEQAAATSVEARRG